MAIKGTTTKTAQAYRSISQRVSPSGKTPVPAKPPFGTSSQFKGFGRGIPGDLRR